MLDPDTPCRRATPRSPQRQKFDRFVRARGLNAGDFQIEERNSADLADMLGVTGTIVAVRRLSNGVERLYAGGPGSAWLAATVHDIDCGQFGKA